MHKIWNYNDVRALAIASVWMDGRTNGRFDVSPIWFCERACVVVCLCAVRKFIDLIPKLRLIVFNGYDKPLNVVFKFQSIKHNKSIQNKNRDSTKLNTITGINIQWAQLVWMNSCEYCFSHYTNSWHFYHYDMTYHVFFFSFLIFGI